MSRPAQGMGASLLDYVRANPGSRADQIAKALGTTPDKMRKSMQALLDSKQVKRSGVRRGTTYHVAEGAPTTVAPRMVKKMRRAKRGRNQAAAGLSIRQRLVRLTARSQE
jgi:predicted ArsR family transcriptional regulator